MVLVLGGFVNQFFHYAASGDPETFAKETSKLWHVPPPLEHKEPAITNPAMHPTASNLSTSSSRNGLWDLSQWYLPPLLLPQTPLTSRCQTCFRISSMRISSTLRLSYITSIFRQDLTYFDTLALNPVLTGTDNHLSTDHTDPAVHKPGTPGSVAVSITTVTSTVQMGIGERIGSVCQSLAMLFAGFGIALTVNWRLTLASAAVVPAAIIAYAFSIPVQVKYDKRILMAYTKAADLAEEVLMSIRTIQSFNAGWAHAKKYDGLLARAKTEGVRKAPLTGVQFFLGAFIMFSAYTICFRYGVSLFMREKIETPGEILM